MTASACWDLANTLKIYSGEKREGKVVEPLIMTFFTSSFCLFYVLDGAKCHRNCTWLSLSMSSSATFLLERKNTSDFSHLENKALLTIHSCLHFKPNYRWGKSCRFASVKQKKIKSASLVTYRCPRTRDTILLHLLNIWFRITQSRLFEALLFYRSPSTDNRSQIHSLGMGDIIDSSHDVNPFPGVNLSPPVRDYEFG
jgi:hypothetical protein